MNRYKIQGLSGGKNNRGLNKNKNERVLTVGRIIFLTFLFLLLTLFFLIYVFLNYYHPPADHSTSMDFGDEFLHDIDTDWENADPDKPPTPNPGTNPVSEWDKDCYNFLILGKDNLGGTTDVMMIIMLNTKENKLSILNLPRDTYVTTKNYSGKINGVYTKGRLNAINSGSTREDAQKAGIEYLKAMIKYTLGIEIKYHVFMDLNGFKALVKAVGGVDMTVPQDMVYNDPEQKLYINLKKGWQHLDENQAEQLVRFRAGYADADIGRIRTQQLFLASLMKKMLKFDIDQIKSIYDVGSKYLITNISATNAVLFATKVLNVKMEDMRTHTMPGNWIPSALRYELYKEETIDLINKYYNPYKKDIPESSFNIYDKDLLYFGGYKPEFDIDGKTLAGLVQ
jgi:LCP family protein required for cell wall assembly